MIIESMCLYYNMIIESMCLYYNNYYYRINVCIIIIKINYYSVQLVLKRAFIDNKIKCNNNPADI